jgi:hypothetical protein
MGEIARLIVKKNVTKKSPRQKEKGKKGTCGHAYARGRVRHATMSILPSCKAL